MYRLGILAAVWLCLAAGLPVAAHEAATPAALCDAIRRDQPAPAANPATPPAAATPTDALTPAQIMAAVAGVALDDRPAEVSREADAGQGTVTLALPEPLGAMQVQIAATSGAAGPIGRVMRDGDYLVFEADHLTYELAPVGLPGGLEIGPQAMDLDPAHADVLCIDAATGAVFRHFRWILTPSNVTYGGESMLILEDTARIEVLGFDDLGEGRGALSLRTRWKGQIELGEWTIDGQAMPGGRIEASSVFEDSYIVDLAG